VCNFGLSWEGYNLRSLSATIVIFIVFLNMYVTLGVAGFSPDNDTGINISNEIIELGGMQAQMVYTIQTPPIVHYDFVLALDSSGSFKIDKDQYDAVIRDVPLFLEKIPGLYPDANFNMSVVSWDDNIDSYYDNGKKFVTIDSNVPLKAKLAPIRNVTNDIKKLEKYYKSSQTEYTDFSVPIRASIDILDVPENKPKNTYGTKRFILLVTGNGEYTPCNPDLLREASIKNYEIYIVSLGVEPESEMDTHLKEIVVNESHSKLTTAGYSPIDRLIYTKSPLEKTLNLSLKDALLEHFNKIMNQPVAYGVKISDRLYGYYKPDLKSLTVVSSKGSSIGSSINSHELEDKTLEIKISELELLPNSTTRVAFNIENTFDPMSLPITVSETDGPLNICTPVKRPNSMFSYNWLFNGNKKELRLETPDHRISTRERLRIQSNASNEALKSSNLIFINLMKYLFLLGY
jgi:hypothetical protein